MSAINVKDEATHFCDGKLMFSTNPKLCKLVSAIISNLLVNQHRLT